MAVYNTRQSGFATLGELAISLMSKLIAGSGTWNGTTGTKLGFKLVGGEFFYFCFIQFIQLFVFWEKN